MYQRYIKLNEWLIYYFPLIMVTQMLTAMRFPIPEFVWGYLFNLFCIGIGVLAFRFSKNKAKGSFKLLLLYFILSVFAYFFNHIPLYCYYRESLSFLLPFMFVFVGMNNNDDRFYKYFLYSVLFCNFIGLGLHFIRPGWYIAYKLSVADQLWYLQDTSMSESDLIFNGIGRYSSFFSNSYPVAFYSSFSLCIIVEDFCKDVKNRIIKSTNHQIVFILFSLLGIVLSISRIAIAYSAVVLLYYYFTCLLYRSSAHFKFVKMFVAGYIVVVALIYVVSLTPIGRDLIDIVFSRFDEFDIESLDSGRTKQNEDVLYSWQNTLFGDGMGSKGGTAAMLGFDAITDGGWTRFLIEYGVIGLTFFCFLILRTICHGLRFRKYMSKEIMIVGYGIASMIGANSLGMGSAIILFWFAIGRIWNSDYLAQKITINDRI